VSFLLGLAVLLTAWLPAAAQAQDSERFFPETGYAVIDDRIWDYFNSRGGVATFGYPSSNVFTLLGFPVQIFQRHVLQVAPDGVRPMNLLDPDVLPVNQINFATFPAHDPAVATAAPGPGAAN
jgi:hypothetical protein